jgi:hypothetical protein
VRGAVLALPSATSNSAGTASRVCLVLNASFRLSVSVLDSLAERDKQLHRSGGQLWLVGLPAAARADLSRDPSAATFGADRVVRTVDEALTGAQT